MSRALRPECLRISACMLRIGLGIENFADDVAFDIRQPPLDTVVFEGQSLVIETQ